MRARVSQVEDGMSLPAVMKLLLTRPSQASYRYSQAGFRDMHGRKVCGRIHSGCLQPTTSLICAHMYPQRGKRTATVPSRDVSLEEIGLAEQQGPGTIRKPAWNLTDREYHRGQMAS